MGPIEAMLVAVMVLPAPGDECCDGTELPEGERCGDNQNGGCNTTPSIWVEAACGEVYCGVVWAEGGGRDTDWYRVVLDQTSALTGTLWSQFPGVVFVVDGIETCQPIVVGEFGNADGCEPAVATAALTAGTYVIFAATQSFDGTPCGGGSNQYRLLIECGPPLPCPGEEGCFRPHESPACATIDCCNAVCDADPFCCETEWDDDCVAAALVVCNNAACGPDAGPCGGANESPGCDDPVCCNIVCLEEPDCCDVVWDQACGDLAIALGCAEPPPAPPNDLCAAALPIFDGATPYTNVGATGPDQVLFCTLIGSDIWYEYTATSDGPVTFDTCDSSFNTAIAVWSGGCCPGDVDHDGEVAVTDLVEVIMSWGCAGPPDACPADVDLDGVVGVSDLAAVIVSWGPCPDCPGTFVTCNASACFPQSSVSFEAEAGACYVLQVAGSQGSQGFGVINVSPPDP